MCTISNDANNIYIDVIYFNDSPQNDGKMNIRAYLTMQLTMKIKNSSQVDRYGSHKYLLHNQTFKTRIIIQRQVKG